MSSCVGDIVGGSSPDGAIIFLLVRLCFSLDDCIVCSISRLVLFLFLTRVRISLSFVCACLFCLILSRSCSFGSFVLLISGLCVDFHGLVARELSDGWCISS